MNPVTERSIETFADAGEVCAEQGALPAAVEELNSRLPLTMRLRILVSGGYRECDSPPDLNGLCVECGCRIARPVASHDRGCAFAPVQFVNRLAVRSFRFSRSVLDDLKGRR